MLSSPSRWLKVQSIGYRESVDSSARHLVRLPLDFFLAMRWGGWDLEKGSEDLRVFSDSAGC